MNEGEIQSERVSIMYGWHLFFDEPFCTKVLNEKISVITSALRKKGLGHFQRYFNSAGQVNLPSGRIVSFDEKNFFGVFAQEINMLFKFSVKKTIKYCPKQNYFEKLLSRPLKSKRKLCCRTCAYSCMAGALCLLFSLDTKAAQKIPSRVRKKSFHWFECC